MLFPTFIKLFFSHFHLVLIFVYSFKSTFMKQKFTLYSWTRWEEQKTKICSRIHNEKMIRINHISSSPKMSPVWISKNKKDCREIKQTYTAMMEPKGNFNVVVIGLILGTYGFVVIFEENCYFFFSFFFLLFFLLKCQPLVWQKFWKMWFWSLLCWTIFYKKWSYPPYQWRYLEYLSVITYKEDSKHILRILQCYYSSKMFAFNS